MSNGNIRPMTTPWPKHIFGIALNDHPNFEWINREHEGNSLACDILRVCFAATIAWTLCRARGSLASPNVSQRRNRARRASEGRRTAICQLRAVGFIVAHCGARRRFSGTVRGPCRRSASHNLTRRLEPLVPIEPGAKRTPVLLRRPARAALWSPGSSNDDCSGRRDARTLA